MAAAMAAPTGVPREHLLVGYSAAMMAAGLAAHLAAMRVESRADCSASCSVARLATPRVEMMAASKVAMTVEYLAARMAVCWDSHWVGLMAALRVDLWAAKWAGSLVCSMVDHLAVQTALCLVEHWAANSDCH